MPKGKSKDKAKTKGPRGKYGLETFRKVRAAHKAGKGIPTIAKEMKMPKGTVAGMVLTHGPYATRWKKFL